MQADAPEHSKLPQADIVGVTVILLTCSYKEQVNAQRWMLSNTVM